MWPRPGPGGAHVFLAGLSGVVETQEAQAVFRPKMAALQHGVFVCELDVSLMATPDTGQGTLLPLWPSEARPFWWARHPESEVTC